MLLSKNFAVFIETILSEWSREEMVLGRNLSEKNFSLADPEQRTLHRCYQSNPSCCFQHKWDNSLLALLDVFITFTHIHTLFWLRAGKDHKGLKLYIRLQEEPKPNKLVYIMNKLKLY